MTLFYQHAHFLTGETEAQKDKSSSPRSQSQLVVDMGLDPGGGDPEHMEVTSVLGKPWCQQLEQREPYGGSSALGHPWNMALKAHL